jgi:hypothetical protein
MGEPSVGPQTELTSELPVGLVYGVNIRKVTNWSSDEKYVCLIRANRRRSLYHIGKGR